MGDFHGDTDFYNPFNPVYIDDDCEVEEITICYFCGEKTEEPERVRPHPHITNFVDACEHCFDYQKKRYGVMIDQPIQMDLQSGDQY